MGCRGLHEKTPGAKSQKHAPGPNRTVNLGLRRASLYPIELQGRFFNKFFRLKAAGIQHLKEYQKETPQKSPKIKPLRGQTVLIPYNCR